MVILLEFFEDDVKYCDDNDYCDIFECSYVYLILNKVNIGGYDKKEGEDFVLEYEGVLDLLIVYGY